MVSFFGRLFRSVPADPTPFGAGVAALERGRFEAALTHFAAALTAAGSARERALIYNKVALTELGRGDRAAAIAAFAEALAADARCVPAIVNLGNLLLEDGAVDDAIVHYEAALRLDDSYGAAHLNFGIALKRAGRRADAVREFRRAHRLGTR